MIFQKLKRFNVVGLPKASGEGSGTYLIIFYLGEREQGSKQLITAPAGAQC